MTDERALTLIKAVHTIAWAFFVGCILGIYYYSSAGRLLAAGLLIAVVMAEVAILACNRMKCPLTGIAAKYTDDRRDNFDIYLPLWLARYNKEIFGTLFVGGVVLTLVAWLLR